MNLISLPFFIFMCCFLCAYYKSGEKQQWKVLLIGNAFFYVYSNPVYIIFIIISIVSTWYLMRNPIKRNFMLTIAINLGLLIIFKYSVNLGVRNLIAPLGISFYTFMTLGYAHDCYDKKIEPCDSLWHYALFISYFPQLTQGPIGTYQEMHDQLISYHRYNRQNIKEGGYRIIIGIFKKLVIAGRVGFYIDTVYSSPKGYSGLTLIVATAFYLVEMYADFSGYMDIVCGVSKMLGINLKENFRRPYLSKSIPEYWRRWHISLNEWFMNHLYMPSVTAGWNRKLSRTLGKIFTKAKKGTLRLIFPTMLVWIVTGIWHGAKSSYLGWGIYFAFVMLVSFCTQSWVKNFNAKIHWNPDNIFIKIFQVARTLLILSFGEIIYRSECFSDTVAIFKGIFTNTRINGAEIAAAMTPFGNGNQAAASIIIIIVLVIAQAVIEIAKEKDEKAFTGHRYIYAFAMLTVIALFGVAGKSSFMYQAF
jgi:D-alanyl-lipoteichoic acid acyltransferase DltB (MBOAT superfamily)